MSVQLLSQTRNAIHKRMKRGETARTQGRGIGVNSRPACVLFLI
jgi:hypothetical protein